MQIYTNPNYSAFGDRGEFTRPARTVGELEHKDCFPALLQAAKNLSIEHVYFGVPIYQTLKMTKSQARKDSRPWLMFNGDSLPLEYVNGLYSLYDLKALQLAREMGEKFNV